MTAVEWFALEIKKVYNISLFEHPDIYEQAREMEKQQIIDGYNYGCIHTLKGKMRKGEQYYTETYEKRRNK